MLHSFAGLIVMWPFRKKQGDVLHHWIASAENFNYSPKTFYEELEKILTERKIPDLTMERIEYAEGGLLSAKRTYLRLQRERLVFDVCAAPFGTGYFFSCRSVQLPVKVKLSHLLVLFIVLNVVWAGLAKVTGPFLGSGLLVLLLLAFLITLYNAAAGNAMSVDAVLTRIPVLGTVYEAWFKRDTYFREDTRLMYLDLVPKLVAGLSETVTSANGVRLVRQYQTGPIFGKLYKRVKPPKPAP